MNVYFCLSEELSDGGGSYEPPEYYCLCDIVVARNRSQAKYLVWHFREPSISSSESILEMPKFVVRKLGEAGDLLPRVIEGKEADPWWAKVPDGIQAPKS